MRKPINFELAAARIFFRRMAKEHHWDDDIRDTAIRMVEREIYLKSATIRAEKARRAKVKKHDDARLLFEPSRRASKGSK